MELFFRKIRNTKEIHAAQVSANERKVMLKNCASFKIEWEKFTRINSYGKMNFWLDTMESMVQFGNSPAAVPSQFPSE